MLNIVDPLSSVCNYYIIILLSITVPGLFCNASVSSNGTVTVTWSYIHTGGLPLTNVSVSYTNDNSLSPIPIPLISVDTTSVTIPDLKAGFEYTFNVTAENSEGSSSTVCGPITPKSGDSLFKITGSWAQFILCALMDYNRIVNIQFIHTLMA